MPCTFRIRANVRYTMIEIRKSREPKRLEQYRQKSGATYADMDKDEENLKKEVLENLLNEQGHLCAYCMRRIPEKRHLPQGVHPTTIEHWFPQNPESKEDFGQGLDYRNMFAVCAGNRGCGDKRNLTCDAKRGNEILKVNPCVPDTLIGISYRANGEIFSTDAVVNEDLNKRLNLNCHAISLPQSRKAALNGLLKDIKKHHATGDIKIYCQRRLEELKQPQINKIPYVGILIDWLEKHT